MYKRKMNLRLFDTDANIIDRTGAESLIPTQESNEIIQGTIAQSAVAPVIPLLHRQTSLLPIRP